MNSCSWFNHEDPEPTIKYIHIPHYIYVDTFVMREATEVPLIYDSIAIPTYGWLYEDYSVNVVPSGYWYSTDSSEVLTTGKRFRISKISYEPYVIPPIPVPSIYCDADSCVIIWDTVYTTIEHNINYAVVEIIDDNEITEDTAFIEEPFEDMFAFVDPYTFQSMLEDSTYQKIFSMWADSSYIFPFQVNDKNLYLMSFEYLDDITNLPDIVFYQK